MEQILITYYADNAKNLHRMVDKILLKFGGLSDKDMDDLISREEYISYVRQFESENAHLREKAENMKVQSEGQKRLDYEYSEWIERFINYIDVKEMTWEMALEFIERIEVNEDGSINIYYKFRNQNVM